MKYRCRQRYADTEPGMKRILGNITFAFAALLLLAGCAKPELVLPEPEESGEGLITLTLINGTFPTRAASDLEDYEKAVQHIDVIIFEKGSDGKPGAWAFHARKDAANLEGQKIVLGKRTDFQDKEYWIYVIANHTSADGSEFSSTGCPNFLVFCQKAAENELVFLTGHGEMGNVKFPQYFLMDGVAYDSAYPPVKDQNGELEYSAVNLNRSDIDATRDVLLKVDLKRAAAKIVVNISEKTRDPENPYGNYVEFTGKGSIQTPSDGKNPDDLITSGFYFRELPYSTSLIADSRYATMGVGHTVKRRNTVKYNGDRFSYSSDNSSITITSYAYARDWSDLDAILSTTIVANIPLESYEYGTLHYVDGEDVPWSTEIGTDGQVHATLTDDLGNKLTYRKDFHVKDDTGKDVAVTGWFGWSKETLPANYYQIPVSQTKMLKRNGYYEVSLSISIPGGSDPGEPVKLEPVSYEVYDWTQKTVTIGNSTEKPTYLALNKDEFEMYNTESDYTLEFASSEDVTVEVVNYYFVDKFGVKKYGYEVDENGKTKYPKVRDNIDLFDWEQTGTTTENATIDKTMTGEYDGYGYDYNWDYWGRYGGTSSKNDWLEEQGVPSNEWPAARTALNNGQSYSFVRTVPVYDDIKATPDPGMSGNIKVVSPMPENNTIRYIELLVRNDNGTPNDTSDDITRTVTIKQYPLVYITNIVGYYSYRDDFKGNGQATPTTYESYSRNNRITGIAYSGGNYYYYPTNDDYTRFFRSKVALGEANASGQHTLYYYTIGSDGSRSTDEYGRQNVRMYHVRITASSNTYILGAPRLTADGYTDPGDDNANMVSPSFMIASRLGFFNTGNHINGVMGDEARGLPLVREHCKQYVEVYEVRDAKGNKTGEKKVLDDWRLPTTKELQIIMDLQGSSGQSADAIDYLLNAYNYYSASGPVPNSKGTSSGTSVRCIRDAFDTK